MCTDHLADQGSSDVQLELQSEQDESHFNNLLRITADYISNHSLYKQTKSHKATCFSSNACLPLLP